MFENAPYMLHFNRFVVLQYLVDAAPKVQGISVLDKVIETLLHYAKRVLRN
jgi:hypothetical protein